MEKGGGGMRKLAWFSGGFALVCLLCCYGPAGLYRPLAGGLAAGTLVVAALRGAQARRALRQGRLTAVLRRGLALLLGGMLAAGWFWGWTAAFRAPAQALTGQTLTLTGTVSAYPRETSVGGRSVTVRLSGGWNAPDAVIYGTDDWAALEPGDVITFTAALESAERIRGEETTYFTAKGVFLLGACKEAPLAVARPEHPGPSTWPARVSRALRNSMAAAFDGDTAGLAAAVALGDKSLLSDGVYSDFNRSGMAHAVVVSGTHISCLVSALLHFSKNRRRTAVVIFPLLIFYALMAGGTPSAFRAVLMQGVLLAAPLARREYDAPTALGFALLLLLLANPYSAGSISLQLSFASVAGITLVVRPLNARLERKLKGLKKRYGGRAWIRLTPLARRAGASAATSLGALVFTQPVMTAYFRQASLVFLPANLLLLPAVVAFLPCALLVGIAGLFAPGLARVLGQVTGLLARYAIWGAGVLGRGRFAAVDTANVYYLLCFAAVYVFLAVGLLLRKGRIRPAVPLCCLAALFGAAFGLTRLPVERAVLTVTALDVGQGSSTAFISDGQTCLVDCGGTGMDDPGDVAANYFASLGMIRLDLLVFTHFDDDHINGAAELFHRMDVRRVALPASEHAAAARSVLLELAAEEGAEVIEVDAVTELTLGTGRVTLYPPLSGGTSNEEGLFVLCSAGDFDALITGDADSFVEKMLVKYYNIPDLELLLLGHHGSAGSTSEELLDALLPELAIASAGRHNSYGHPAEETLARLAQRSIRVFRTDEMGTVSIYVRSDGYAAQSQG